MKEVDMETEMATETKKTAEDMLVVLEGDVALAILPYLMQAQKEGQTLNTVILDLIELVRE